MKNLIYILLLIPMSIFAQDSHTEQRTYIYDDLNRLIEVVFPNGENYKYIYDELGNRTQLTVVTEVQETYVPDDNFEQALIDLGYDSGALDDYVFTHNINDIENLHINDLEIANLTGIEDFTALRFLSCQNNQIQELDISNNLNLISLDIWNNQLTNIDVSNNSQLIGLSVFQNQLTNIDVTNNTSLKYLEYANNQIPNIDLTQNTVLERLDCENNQISSLDISSNFQLKNLLCGNNLLTNIDVSVQPNLEELVIEDNQITSLDISNNPLIEYLNADNNQLTNINVYQNNNLEILSFGYNEVTSFDATQIPQIVRFHCQNNQLIGLDISTNIYLQRLICRENQLENLNLKNGYNATVLAKVDSRSNPDLVCIQVDNETDANNQLCTASSFSGWCKDTDAFYSEDCDVPMTYVPDDNFEGYLIMIGLDTGALNNYVPTANINSITDLVINGEGISDLTGIEDFTALELLSCNGNNLSTLDMSQNANLNILVCSDNQLTSIELSQNTNLTQLSCEDNQLSDLHISQNGNLEIVSCSSNQLTYLDISGNSLLRVIDCFDNQITSINTTTFNTNMYEINCSGNELTSLDVSQFPNLSYFYAHHNGITSLDFSQNPNLYRLECDSNALTTLNLANGNNSILDVMVASINPTLQCIQVDDVDYANNRNTCFVNSWCKDDLATFKLDCNATNNDLVVILYPNPTESILYINNPFNADLTLVTISNALGQVIMTITNVGNEIDISNLSNGIYYVTLQDVEGRELTLTVVKE